MNNFPLETYLHRFQRAPITPLPEVFNFPHQYEPHDWVIYAAQQLQEAIPNTFKHSFDTMGKMFGILVVKTKHEIRFLAAFSGKIDNETKFLGYVPPIFDTQDNDSFYKLGEMQLDEMNLKIHQLENAIEWIHMNKDLASLDERYHAKLISMKALINQNKLARQQVRSNRNTDASTIEFLSQQSKKEQFEIKNIKKEFKHQRNELNAKIGAWQTEIERQKEHRSLYSVELQKKLFEAYKLTNFKNETKNILEIFSDFTKDIPPSGTGECALPKLLHFAATHQFTPVCFGEFWWGASPIGEVRKHKAYYPACRSKCEPLLSFLLHGVSCQSNPVLALVRDAPIRIIYEDSWILAVEKPSGVLSVPGRTNIDSAEDRLKHMFPRYPFIKAIHRLDMGTSGILLFAKDAIAHQSMQQLFARQKVTKIYEAILSGIPSTKEGTIQLPLRLDINHRPHQMVCFEHGKKAETYFKVMGNKSDNTRIEFYPKTGRTHQLRVHAAHQLGLNCPILGDELYGIHGARLHLHAKYLAFYHPQLKQPFHLHSKVPF